MKFKRWKYVCLCLWWYGWMLTCTFSRVLWGLRPWGRQRQQQQRERQREQRGEFSQEFPQTFFSISFSWDGDELFGDSLDILSQPPIILPISCMRF